MKVPEVSTTDPEVLDPDAWDTRFGGPPIAVRQAIVACRRATQQKVAAERAASATLDELADLRRRLDHFEQLFGVDAENLVEGLGRVLPKFVHRETEDLKRRLADLEARTPLVRKDADDLVRRVDELERAQMRFRGTYKSGELYRAGDLTIRSGSLWVCLESTTEPPGGSGSGHWQLAVKRGSVASREPGYA
jgi:hypothetical protein